jgi:hypothetical protein
VRRGRVPFFSSRGDKSRIPHYRALFFVGYNILFADHWSHLILFPRRLPRPVQVSRVR